MEVIIVGIVTLLIVSLIRKSMYFWKESKDILFFKRMHVVSKELGVGKKEEIKIFISKSNKLVGEDAEGRKHLFTFKWNNDEIKTKEEIV